MKKRAQKPKVPDPDAISAGMGAKPRNKGQIEKGQRLNPLGRPIGSKNKPKPVTNAAVRDIIRADNRRTHTVQDANGPVTLTTVELAFRSLGIKAARGSVLAARSYLELSRWAEREESEGIAQVLAGTIEYKMRYNELKRSYARRGQKVPSHIPDGDSFILGPEGLVGIRDAATKGDIALWKAFKRNCETELTDLQEKLEGAKPGARKRIEKEISTAHHVMQIVEAALAGERPSMWVLDQGPGLEAWATGDTSSEPRKAAPRRPRQPRTTKPRA